MSAARCACLAALKMTRLPALKTQPVRQIGGGARRIDGDAMDPGAVNTADPQALCATAHRARPESPGVARSTSTVPSSHHVRRESSDQAAPHPGKVQGHNDSAGPVAQDRGRHL